MNLLLTLQPYSLEQAFWRCKCTRRALMLADVCAYTTALLHMNMSVLRMAATQPSKPIFSIHLGSEHWLFNLGFISTIYQTSALLLLLAIALSTWTAAAAAGRRREPFYTRHRHTLCLMSRLLRLFYCMAHLLQPGAMSFFAHAIAARTRDVQQRPMKALLVNVLHPTAFWMAQANFVLPWRWMLLIQLVNSAAVLALWSRPLPCLLQAVQLKPFNASELFYQAQATDACKALQYASFYIRMWIGDVTYMTIMKMLAEVLVAEAFGSTEACCADA
ncbi:hypothetical protein OEZ86_013485 [Tetradesmus obliquus]|nr:hypothetical protein OEZ86_013485 [Tetradesmus obliquus]